MRVKNQKGFSLIEMLIAASVLTVLAVGMSQFIVSQHNNVSNLEDRLTKVSLEAQLKIFLTESSGCTQTFTGKQALATQPITQIFDSLGAVQFDTASGLNKFDFLELDSMTLENISVPGPDSTGRMKLEVQVKRIRGKLGSNSLKPINIEFTVSTNSSNEITTCGGSGSFDVGEFFDVGPYPWYSTCNNPEDTWTVAGNIGAGRGCIAHVERFTSNYRYNSVGCKYDEPTGEVRICGGQVRNVVCKYACFN